GARARRRRLRAGGCGAAPQLLGGGADPRGLEQSLGHAASGPAARALRAARRRAVPRLLAGPRRPGRTATGATGAARPCGGFHHPLHERRPAVAGDLAAAAALRFRLARPGHALPALAAAGGGGHARAGRLGHRDPPDRGDRMRQRGVILISALLITALAAVVAAPLFFDTGLTARRATANFAMEQALQIAQGAEALAVEVLREDRNATDTPQDDWAQQVEPVEIVEGSVVLEARVLDLAGRFNLNTLINADGEQDENAMKVFRRLLELLELDERW